MTFKYDDTVSPDDVRIALGLDGFHEFAMRQIAENKAHRAAMLDRPHGLSRQTGRSTIVMVNEITTLLSSLKHIVAFPFAHHDSPKTEENARHDRRRFNKALADLGVEARVHPLKQPWLYEYMVLNSPWAGGTHDRR